MARRKTNPTPPARPRRPREPMLLKRGWRVLTPRARADGTPGEWREVIAIFADHADALAWAREWVARHSDAGAVKPSAIVRRGTAAFLVAAAENRDRERT